jgi:ABC-type Fe3+-hydroxamate transport system substrate-binding protein
MAGMQVVSLVPSVTETLVEWGVVPVACTRFCEQPDLRHVGGTKNPDVEAIVELHPDLVVMDREENRREDHDRLVEAGLDVLATAVVDLGDVEPTLRELARRVGAPAPPPLPSRPAAPVSSRAFVPIWRRPWMALGTPTYGTSLLRAMGIENVYLDRGAYPEVDLEDAAARGPDLVIAPSEPYPFAERHVTELSSVAPVVLVDGKDLVWWGARTGPAVGRLARSLGPGPPKVVGSDRQREGSA